ncbi:MAG: DUF1854 domain-containing protein [Ruminiclostridium sp.]|nr:DUF1854 domain-containing protein [Ruminiclostridium sp.]
MIKNTESVFEVDTLKILLDEDITLEKAESGFLNAEVSGERYERVSLTRLIPFVDEEKYISVTYRTEDKEWKEIGVIEDIKNLSADKQEIVREYLSFKYYIPTITKINKITDNRMGYLFLEAETTAGKKKIAVNDWWHNFRVIQDKMLSVTDADGNRYCIPELEKLDKASVKKLQLFI